MKKYLAKDLLLITVGAFIYAFGVTYFFVANKLADGGIAGVSLVLHYLFNFNISITYFVLNVPILILGYWYIGKQFMLKTIYGTIATTISLRIVQNYQGPMEDTLMAAIFGGLLIGIGLGLILIGGGSSGGTDTLAKAINKFCGLSLGKGFLILNSLVLTSAGIIFGKEVFMYTLVGTFVSTKAIDFLQDGFEKAKGLLIISTKSEEIKSRILKETGRGITIIDGKGGYTNNEKAIIYCVVRKYEETAVKRIVKDIDKHAFMTITEVTDVLGEGFKNIEG